MADALRSEVILAAAVAHDLDVESEAVQKALRFSARQRQSLLGWAPYAVKHVHRFLDSMDEAGAWIFAAILGLSIVRGVGELSKEAKIRKAKPTPFNVVPPEPKPEPTAEAV